MCKLNLTFFSFKTLQVHNFLSVQFKVLAILNNGNGVPGIGVYPVNQIIKNTRHAHDQKSDKGLISKH